MFLPPLSLYIHIPWCVRKCPYCDFNSHEILEPIPESEYIAALFADLEQDLPRIWGRTVRSIFIGGGTPSVLSPKSLNDLLSGIRTRIPVVANAEITIEANPGTVDIHRFNGFREAGINRLSLGIQSFNDNALQSLGRIHGKQEALFAIETAKHVGFQNINLDLMFGLPGQTLETALEDLRTAIAFQPSHISWYQLTIEPNTLFYHQPPALPNDDLLWDIQTNGQTYLAEQGYLHYEISAYAKPEQQCQHNLNYWKFGDYLGIGAGAHAKITNISNTAEKQFGFQTPYDIKRFSKQRHPRAYLHSAHTSDVIASDTTLTAPEVCLEFMMNALRLREGFTIEEFNENTGLTLSIMKKSLEQAYHRGWLITEFSNDSHSNNEQRIRITEMGMRFLNDVLDLFVP